MLKENSDGQLTIISVISLSLILLSVTFSQLFIGYSEYSQSVFDNESDQAQSLAEAAIDNAIEEYEVNSSNVGTSTFKTPIGSVSVTTTINNATTPPELSVSASDTFDKITRKYQAQFNIGTVQTIEDYSVYLQNNLWAQNSEFNGEIYTNNNTTFTGSTINGDLYAAGQGNGNQNTIDSTTVSPYAASGGTGSVYWWDRSYIQNHSEVKGNLSYHANTSIDNTSKVDGSATKNFGVTPIVNTPSFDFNSAQTLATTQGTYYANQQDFFSYVNSLTPTVSNGTDIYTLPSNKLYYIDCGIQLLGVCIDVFIYPSTDNQGKPMEIKGSNISIVMNANSLLFGGIDITSPYQTSGGQYYPALVTNGITTYFATPLAMDITGLIYDPGSIYFYGFSNSTQDVLDGGVWSGDQLTFYGYTDVTYDGTYLNNIDGFDFPTAQTDINYWNEVP